MVLFNEVYTIAKNQYDLDLNTMNKPELIKFCLKVLSRNKDLETDKNELLGIINRSESEYK